MLNLTHSKIMPSHIKVLMAGTMLFYYFYIYYIIFTYPAEVGYLLNYFIKEHQSIEILLKIFLVNKILTVQ